MASIIRMSGTVFTEAQLDNGHELHVVVVGGDGVEFGNGFGRVVAVTDRPRNDNPQVIERIYSVRVS